MHLHAETLAYALFEAQRGGLVKGKLRGAVEAMDHSRATTDNCYAPLGVPVRGARSALKYASCQRRLIATSGVQGVRCEDNLHNYVKERNVRLRKVCSDLRCLTPL